MYLFLKMVHFWGLISWMAAILYLWRLLIYFQESVRERDLLAIMATRLAKYILIPAMLITWIAGLSMVFMNPYLFKSGWIHLKFLLLFLLVGASHGAWSMTRRLPQAPKYSSRTLRVLNEVPTVLMMAIVYLAVFRPF